MEQVEIEFGAPADEFGQHLKRIADEHMNPIREFGLQKFDTGRRVRMLIKIDGAIDETRVAGER